MMTRKMSAMPETRMKYQEKASNPPLAGRGPYPFEIRMSVLLFPNLQEQLLCVGGNEPVKERNKYRLKHNDRRGNEADDGEGQDDIEHDFLIMRSLAQKDVCHHRRLQGRSPAAKYLQYG